MRAAFGLSPKASASSGNDIGRVGYVFLCIVPFLNVILAGARVLRPAHLPIGLVLFAAIGLAAWVSGARVLASGPEASRQLALAGVLLILPFALVALLWVGIGAPFEASLAENHMRFVILVVDSLLITIAFVATWAAITDRGERLVANIALAAGLCAGTAYFGCLSISLAQVVTAVQGGKLAMPPIATNFYNGLEFFACLLTYLTVILFASSMSRAGLLGRGPAAIYAATAALFIVFLLMRGFEYPEISGRTAPWYTQPGVIAGIPAVPWLMPTLLGVVLIRRAGEAKP